MGVVETSGKERPLPSPPLLSQGREQSNIAAALPRLARERPDQIAIRCPGRNGRYDDALTYAQLDARSDAIAAGMARHGIVRGTRTVVMLRPTPEFFLAMFALFKAGAVPVLVDPGIDRRALKQCLNEAQPEAFISIALAHFARVALGWAKSARVRITTGALALLADATLAQVEREGAGIVSNAGGPRLADTAPEDVAAILFTSGSTGVPKGVVYRHRHLKAQIAMLRDVFGIQPGGVDLPTFPPFALFDPALGLTSIVPDMDPTRPARADPRKLLAAIERFGVTQLFGSPALMAVLARHGEPLPTVKRVTSAGAPVPAAVVETMLGLLPGDAQFWTPYGATECLPVAAIEGRELLALRERTESGAGTCVGRPVAGNEVRLIRIDDADIPEWSDELLVWPGEIGEITVAGPTATDSYFNRDEATRLAKIRESRTQPSPASGGGPEPLLPLAGGEEVRLRATGSGADEGPKARPEDRTGWDGRASAASQYTRIVHRMGDLGWFDADGRLWFCGRKSQRVVTADGTLCTEQVEPVFNVHPDVSTALVGIGAHGAQRPVLCVELRDDVPRRARARIERELREIGQRFPRTSKIDTFLFHSKFPLDIRHNAKIGREQLAAWAAKRLDSSPCEGRGRLGGG